MQLNDFLKAGGPKIRKALEQHLGISKSYLSQLATGRAAISPSRCIVIETFIGPGKCFPSTFYKRINAGDRKGACEAIRWWIKDGGRDCRLTKGQKNGCYGQVERRDQEGALACWGLD